MSVWEESSIDLDEPETVSFDDDDLEDLDEDEEIDDEDWDDDDDWDDEEDRIDESDLWADD